MKRDYANQKDFDRLIVISTVRDYIIEFLGEWIEHDALDKNEKKFLKTSMTYAGKFIEEFGKRLTEKQLKRMIKILTSKRNTLVVTDEYQLNRIMNNYDKNMEISHIPRIELEAFCKLIKKDHCENCHKSMCDCEYYDFFEENFISKSESECNCPYAYKKLNVNKYVGSKVVAKTKANNVSKKMSRKQKKISNRFDVDDNIEFTYNTKKAK